jgi:hypothetical protein
MTFQCVIGYLERASGRLWAYTGSTVPWHLYMSHGTKNNLLPTGCYIYKKGTHRPATEAHWVTPALRLSDADGAESGKATVLRTVHQLVFDTSGDWDYGEPSDNIHCAYSTKSFSSLGCQTIKGGMHDGLWPLFQTRLKSLPEHARVDYLLFTGAECSIAAGFILAGKPTSDADVAKRLGRLRTGSEGDEVKRLQARLQVDQTGYFGASTKKTLTTVQHGSGITVDGIYTPAMDAKLGWGVFQQQVA